MDEDWLDDESSITPARGFESLSSVERRHLTRRITPARGFESFDVDTLRSCRISITPARGFESTKSLRLRP